jgi:hypothetical protein
MNFPDVGSSKGNGSGIGSGVFLRLKDGERIQGVFQGDPHIFRQHWIGKRSVICSGKTECEHCKAGDKPKFRFRINFLTKMDGVWLAKVFEQGYGTYLDLKEMHESSYDLQTTFVSLSRSGEKTDTRYRVLPVRDNGGLKPEHFKKLSAIPLNELAEKGEASAAEGLDVDSTGDDVSL